VLSESHHEHGWWKPLGAHAAVAAPPTPTRLKFGLDTATLGCRSQSMRRPPVEADRAAAERLEKRFFGAEGVTELREEAEAKEREKRRVDHGSITKKADPFAPIRCTHQTPFNPYVCRPAVSWSGCPDLNRGPLRPERSALTKLRHSPS
jgi:hypothetical protein